MKRKITTSCFAFVTALAALLAFSCSNMNGSSSDSEQNSIDKNKAYITLSVKDEGKRTALPSYELSEFNEFQLLGKTESIVEKSLGSWTSADSKSAYDLMKEARIQIELGEWTFRLKATEASGTAYEGSVTKTLELGANQIAFKIDLVTVPESGKGNLSVGIEVKTRGELNRTTATLYKNDDSDTLVKAEADISGDNVTFENLDVGSYKVLFNFYDEKGLLLGSCPEYAIVVPGKTSSSSVKLESLDGTYTITYHDGENSTTAKYTRHTKVLLPNTESTDVQKDGFVFCGWFATSTDAEGYTASAITKIPENTVGAQKFYAKYMSLVDVTPIKSVVLNGEVKVGNTLKAVPYTKESAPAESDKFTGEIASYKWYVGEDSNGDSTISDEEWQAITGATTDEYKIRPDDLGKAIKAEIIQKYTVEEDTEKKINVVKTENAPVSSAVTANVEKGTLKEEDITELIKTLTVLYDENTPVIIGTALDGTKVSVIPASGTIKDSQENDVPVTLETALAAGQTAPTFSNYVPVTITVKATGYEDVVKNLLATDASPSPLFVYVKQPQVESTQIPTLATEETPATPTITGGYVKFNSTETEGLEYTVTDSSASAPASNAIWNPVTYAEFKNGEEVFSVDGGEKIFIRRAGAAGEADAKGNPVGYIEPSVIYSDAISVLPGNVGKKNALKIIKIDFGALSEIAVTSTPTENGCTLTVENASNYISFDWITEAQILEYTNGPLTISPSGGTATVTVANDALPGVYGVVVTASTSLATYSTTVYITVGTN